MKKKLLVAWVSLIFCLVFFSCDDFAETMEDELSSTYTFFATTDDTLSQGIPISYKIGEHLSSGDLPNVSRDDFAQLKIGYNINGWEYWKNPISGSTTVPDNFSLKSIAYQNDDKSTTSLHDQIAAVTVGADLAWLVVTKWTPVNYYVAFDANGGSGSVERISLRYDETFLTFPAVDGFSLNGYNPTGWNTAANRYRVAPEYQAGDTLSKNLATKEGAVVTYYVCWEARDITISFASGAGSGTMSVMTNAKVGDTLPAHTLTSPFSYYEFDHWECTSISGTHTYRDGERLTTANYPNENATLTAKWGTTVTFSANGGSGSTATQRLIYGEAQSLLQNAFTRFGYDFDGWNTAADGSGTSYTDQQSVTVIAGTTLYAQWKPQTYTISYNANGGAGRMSAQTIAFDELPTTLEANEFTYTGHDFIGWNTEINGIVTYTDEESITQSNWLTGDLTLYAQWARKTFDVTFVANGGTGSMSSQSFSYGIEQPIQENVFTRQGWTFTGWNTKDDGTGTAYADRALMTVRESGIVLYAQWEEQTLTITYNANDGTGSLATQTIRYSALPQSLTANNDAITREGYYFRGWNTKDDGTGIAYTDVYAITTGNWDAVRSLASQPNVPLTLYAVWEARGVVSDAQLLYEPTSEGIVFTAPPGSSYQWMLSPDLTDVTTRTYTVTYSDYENDDTTHLLVVLVFDDTGIPTAYSVRFKVQ